MEIGSAFANPTLPSLAEVWRRIEARATLPPARKAEVKSALRSFEGLTGSPLLMTPAHADYVRRRLASVSPAAHGISEKRFANIKSAILFALRLENLVAGRYLAPLANEWADLWSALPSKYARTAFSRFFRYCSAQGIEPANVDDAVAANFLEALIAETLVRNPKVAHQNLCRVWNRMIGVVPGWPQRRLTVPRYAQHYILPPECFPAAFWADVDAWLRQQAHDDILALGGPPRPLAPRTLRQYRYSLRAFASMLVHRGHRAADITSLAYLVRPKNVEHGLRFLLERHGNKHLRSGADLASMLRKIAKHWVKARKTDVAIIARYAQNLMPRGDGLGDKNRRRLAPLRDEKNLVRLFLLPGKIRKEVERASNVTREHALLMQLAVALVVLTYAPLRIGNLARLHVEHHLRWSGPRMTGALVIDIDGGQVKNRQTLHFPLPTEAADLIRLYLRKHQPILSVGPSGWLFPSDLPDRAKRSDTLGKQLTRLIRRTTGLEVNPHLYRHLVHIIVLNRYPGAYAMISRILGHRSLQTALSNYATEDIGIAMSAFHGLVGDVIATGRLGTASIGAVAKGLNPRLGG